MAKCLIIVILFMLTCFSHQLGEESPGIPVEVEKAHCDALQTFFKELRKTLVTSFYNPITNWLIPYFFETNTFGTTNKKLLQKAFYKFLDDSLLPDPTTEADMASHIASVVNQSPSCLGVADASTLWFKLMKSEMLDQPLEAYAIFLADVNEAFFEQYLVYNYQKLLNCDLQFVVRLFKEYRKAGRVAMISEFIESYQLLLNFSNAEAKTAEVRFLVKAVKYAAATERVFFGLYMLYRLKENILQGEYPSLSWILDNFVLYDINKRIDQYLDRWKGIKDDQFIVKLKIFFKDIKEKEEARANDVLALEKLFEQGSKAAAKCLQCEILYQIQEIEKPEPTKAADEKRTESVWVDPEDGLEYYDAKESFEELDDMLSKQNIQGSQITGSHRSPGNYGLI